MLICVDATNDIAEFLTSRRARVTPEQAGLPTWGPRRVKGLRREEVASLAGVSVEYYKRLERGNASGVSDAVLEALARALQLDDAERAHLFDLARAANPVAPKRRRPAVQRVRPVVLRILESITAPAIVRNSRVDYLAANLLGRALYAPLFDSREQPPNIAVTPKYLRCADLTIFGFFGRGSELPRRRSEPEGRWVAGSTVPLVEQCEERGVGDGQRREDHGWHDLVGVEQRERRKGRTR